VTRVAVAVVSAFFALAMLLAAATFWPVYQSGRFLLMVVIATAVGCGIALAGRAFRWSAPVVAAVTVAAFAALGVPLAVPDAAIAGVLPSLDGLRQLFLGSALAWKQLVTVSPPVGEYQALLVPPFLLTLVGSVVGLSAATRSRWGHLGALAPVAVFVASIALGLDYSRWPRTTGLALLALILAMIVARRTFGRRAAVARLAAVTTPVGAAPAIVGAERSRTLRSAVSAIVIVVFASVVSVGLVSALPASGAREVVRTAVSQPFDPRDYPSPLSAFRAYLDAPNSDAVMFSVDGLPANSRIRIATMDSYDGVVYTVGSADVDSASGYFTRLPYRVDRDGSGGTPASVSVTIGSYSGIWVPTVGDLESIAFEGSRATTLDNGFFFNETTGTAAALAGLEAGDRYRLQTVLPLAPDAAAIERLTPGSATVPAPAVLPEELEVVLADFVAGASTPGERLTAMLAGLHGGYLSHGLEGEEPTPSGHSAARITRLLTDQRMIGDQEQFAVTGALMADELGFPARVVFGFAPDVVASGTTQVTGSAVSAWIEVDTAAYGWVALDPTPEEREIPPAETDQEESVSRPPAVVDPPVQEAPSTEREQTPGNARPEDTPVAGWLVVALAVARVVGIVLLVLAVLVSPFVAVIGAKGYRRRRRRRAGDAVERVTGGWSEFEDAVVDHGFDPPPSPTRVEFASSVGGSRAVLLATAVDRAVFAPEAADAEDADQVWRVVDELVYGLDRRTTRWRRVRARVSLRSFGDSRAARFLLRRGGER
jgi:hypothetical protein